ncbi:phage scaffolding protein [Streptomyces sp. NBC_00075]|uniref:phage scaffolding protein n=1 Tax=Streptomyces sp. NBC_00075 TaxID=2975641 RepID=UPI00386B09FB
MTDNERPNDIEAMQAALQKANAEAQKHREQRNTYRGMATRLAAEKTLSEAGLTNSKVAKYLDFSQVTVTDTGELEGLAEQLDALKEDLPELFGVTKRISGGGDAADKAPATRKPKTSADALANQLMGS